MQQRLSGYRGVKAIAVKPAGGFCFVRVRSLLAVWALFRASEISFYDMRVWLACHEILARRCKAQDRIPQYREQEVLDLVSTGNRPKVRASINRLTSAGLLHWTVDRISTGTYQAEAGLNNDKWLNLLENVTNNRRKVPVARRMICYLSKSRSVSLHMAAWGHMLRCMYYRKDRCVSGGRVKSSWIAEVFGGDERNIKKARKQLIEIGWLIPIACPQIVMNRWGLQTVINLHWSVPGSEAKTPLLKSENEPKRPPLIDRKLSYSKRSTNHKLKKVTGVEDKPKSEAPRIEHITQQDLQEPRRLDELYRQAMEAGIVSGSWFSRLQWFAAAERAVALGKQNPCGLFAAIFRRGLWHHITNEQEDLARGKLKWLDFGEESRLPGDVRARVPDYDNLAA